MNIPGVILGCAVLCGITLWALYMAVCMIRERLTNSVWRCSVCGDPMPEKGLHRMLDDKHFCQPCWASRVKATMGELDGLLNAALVDDSITGQIGRLLGMEKKS